MEELIVGPESASAVKEMAELGSKAIDVLKDARTVEKAQNFFEKVIGETVELATDVYIKDPLRRKKVRNLADLNDDVAKILNERNVKETQAVSPSIAEPLLEAASNESREGLRDLWAKLIAAAMDPDRSNGVSLSIIETVKKMEPIDARVLRMLYEEHQKASPPVERLETDQRDRVSKELGVRKDTVEVSFRDLTRLQCVIGVGNTGTSPAIRVALLPFGREVMRAVSN